MCREWKEISKVNWWNRFCSKDRESDSFKSYLLIWSLLWQNHFVIHKSLPSESDVCDIGASFPSSFCSCTLIKATLSWISHFCWTIYWYYMPQESIKSILKCLRLKYKPWRHCWLSTCDAAPGFWNSLQVNYRVDCGLTTRWQYGALWVLYGQHLFCNALISSEHALLKHLNENVFF